MRSALALAALVVWGFGADSVNFDAVKPGTPPPNWTFLSTRPQEHTRWEVRYDRTAPSRGNVLEKHSGTVVEGDSPIAVFDKVVCPRREFERQVPDRRRRKEPHGGDCVAVRRSEQLLPPSLQRGPEEHCAASSLNGKREPVPVISDKRTLTWLGHDINVGQWYVAGVSFAGTRYAGSSGTASSSKRSIPAFWAPARRAFGPGGAPAPRLTTSKSTRKAEFRC